MFFFCSMESACYTKLHIIMMTVCFYQWKAYPEDKKKYMDTITDINLDTVIDNTFSLVT